MIFEQDHRCRGRGKSKKNSGHCVELLAPAGSYESFRAALLTGADAVYAGGPYFGARAYAENFTKEQLLEAIDEAHLHGLRFYLTVNTLVKDKEIPLLFTYLEPLYRNGLDAVIVQDVGVLEAIRTAFPKMDIHASTQMTITGAEGAKFLQECGAVRVVLARELSLEEIRHIKQETGMEIECFVHGALCYCYSGQCLLSSLIGGRSGNRGQCAQPCRLPYAVDGKRGHLLSLKDICTLELIPDLIEAGIDSFKMEGRMKSPEYVAGVTSMYRKYIELYQEKGRERFTVSEKDKEILMDLYNRGGFHTGYYLQRNGKDMVSVDRPNHAGVPAVKVFSQKGREISGCTLTEIHKGDVLSFPQQGNDTLSDEVRGPKDAKCGMPFGYTFGKDYEKKSSVKLFAPKGIRLKKDHILYRTKNERLLADLQTLCSGKIQEKVYGFLSLVSGKPAKLTVCMGEISVQACSEGLVEKAEKSPLDETRVRKQMEKTGNTEFVFEKLEIELEEGVFLPMQQMNELRRRTLEMLRQKICGQFRREFVLSKTPVYKEQLSSMGKEQPQNTGTGRMDFSILAGTIEQLEEICTFPEISRIYIDSGIFWDSPTKNFRKELEERIQQMRERGTEMYLAMPHILRNESIGRFEELIEYAFALRFHGILLRNFESYGLWKSKVKKRKAGSKKPEGLEKNVILDQNLYVMNRFAKEFWIQQGVHEFTVPAELNRQEILKLKAEQMELLIYGYLPVMVTAQCIVNTVEGCRRRKAVRTLADRYQNNFYVENRCEDCYNIVYNSVPLCLFDEKEALEEIHPSRLRLQFTVEDRLETRKVLQEFRHIFLEGSRYSLKPENFTRGHFRRGVL